MNASNINGFTLTINQQTNVYSNNAVAKEIHGRCTHVYGIPKLLTLDYLFNYWHVLCAMK